MHSVPTAWLVIKDTGRKKLKHNKKKTVFASTSVIMFPLIKMF